MEKKPSRKADAGNLFIHSLQRIHCGADMGIEKFLDEA
jgi:hypothetical protein